VRRIASGGLAVGLVAGLIAVAPTAAQAVDPPGTVVLASGLSAFSSFGRVASASSGGAVLTYGPRGPGGGEGNVYAHAVLVPATGPAVDLDPSLPWDIQGSMLTASTYTTADGVTYRSVSGTVSGSQLLVAGDQYVGATPTGWLVRRDVTSGAGTTTHLRITNATTLATTDLGPIPNYDPTADYAGVVTGPNGVVIEDNSGTDVTRWYVPYAAPHTYSLLTAASSAFTCTSPVVGTNAAAWIESTDGGVSSQLVRITLATKAIQRTTLAASYCGGTIAITPTQTGVEFLTNAATPTNAFETVAATGGATQLRTDLNFDGNWGFAAEGSKFLVPNGLTLTDAGVYKFATASATPTLLRLWGQSPLTAGVVAVGPGRVAWTDNSTTGVPAWSRTLTSSGGGLSAGAPSLVAAHSTTYGLSVSGQRTLFATNDVSMGGAATLSVTTGGGAPALIVQEPTGIRSATLSGTRVLYSDNASTWHLVDMVKGLSKKLPTAGGYALSGNSVAALHSDGSVWWEDLTGGGWVQILPPPADPFSYGTVAVAGDEVAWVINTCGAVDCTATAAHRNARTLSPVVDLPQATNTGALQMSSGYVAYGDYSVGPQVLATSLATGTTTAIPDAIPFNFGLSGSTIGWLGSDGLPRAIPLPALPDRPRYLGNGYAPPLSAVGQPWTADLVTSAPLTSCQVLIKKGTTLLRTLPCDTALAAQGEAVATWDRKNGSGVTVALGLYKWQLVAANADGSLLAGNGTTTAVGGSFTLQ